MPTEIRRTTSNTVQTVISHAQISNIDGGFVKSVDKLYADVGDAITYTIFFQNTGNTPANNIVFSDLIPNITTLVQNSVKLNGITQAGADPQNGINVGILGPGARAKIEFAVLVATLPSPNIITNQGEVRYTYTSDPANPNGDVAVNGSNIVSTTINSGQLSNLVKTVDRQFADIGDEIYYSIVGSNVGNVSINEVVISDTIPNGTKFIDNSISINGIDQIGNIQDGINIGSIAVGDVFTATFRVEVITVPSPNPIKNQALVKYVYTVDPKFPNGTSKQSLSSEAITQVNSAKLELSKKVDPVYVDIDDVATYIIEVKNRGNIEALNVLITDTIPNATKLIGDSVTINGVPQLGANPETGVYVGTINPGTVATVVFKATIDTLPNPNRIPNQAMAIYSYVSDPSVSTSTTYYEPSNVSVNIVNHGDVLLKKYADKCYASIGDEIIYSLGLMNTGNVSLNNIVVTDTIPFGTSIIPGSIRVNGIPQLGASLNNGVSVSTIGVADTATVTFKVRVNQLVPGNILDNYFDALCQYTKDPLIQNGGRRRRTSNVTTIVLNDAGLGRGPNSFAKTVDKEYAGLREVVTYSIFLENKGNVSATNVVVKDNIPITTSFIEDSVEINGTVIPGFLPAQGIPLGTINPGDKVVVSFKVRVDVIPSPNIIKNQALLTYNYTKNPIYVDCEFVTATSNETQVNINHGEVLEALTPESNGFTMTSDKCFARRGEVISYNFNIPNSGNAPVENVVFSACIPEGTKLVEDSVVVNGGILLGVSPEDGVLIGRINPGDPASVYFKVEVICIPRNNVASSRGCIEYEYCVWPNKPSIRAMSRSNIISIPLGDAKIDCSDGGFINLIDRKYAQIGDIVTHTIILKNTGNIEAIDALVVNNLDNGNKLVPGSVTINNVLYNSIDPNRGITLTAIGPNEITTINFKSTVVTIPRDGKIKNVSSIDYLYKYNCNEKPISVNSVSNEVCINVRSVNIQGSNFKGSCDAEYAAVGDIITYNYDIDNTGNINAENVLFKSKIHEGTKFVDDSVLINNYPSLGIDPERGIYIGGIQPGYPQKISYKVKILSLPRRNPVASSGVLCYESRVDESCSPAMGSVTSNMITTEIKSPDVIITKECSTKSTVVGETIEYKVNISNRGNMEVFNFVLSEQLPPELEFKQGSVSIDGNSDYLADMLSGVDVGVIYPRTYCTVSYKAKVVETSENHIITSKALASYEFVVDPNKSERQEIKESNVNAISVEVAEIVIETTSDKKYVVLGDVINYSILVENVGSILASDIMLIDKLPQQIDFVRNSLVVNGQRVNSVDICKGINIGNLSPYKKALIQYKAKVSRTNTGCVIENQAYAIFNYRSAGGIKENNKFTDTVSVKINTASPTFKELNQDGILYVPQPKVGIQEVDIVNADVEILDYHVVKTMEGISAENKKSTGYKLVVNGILKQILEYTACDTLQSVHSSRFERKFSTFINLPREHEEGSHIVVDARIEDIYFNKLTDREVFTNITLYIEANNIC